MQLIEVNAMVATCSLAHDIASRVCLLVETVMKDATISRNGWIEQDIETMLAKE
jgi:hypothetical protein